MRRLILLVVFSAVFLTAQGLFFSLASACDHPVTSSTDDKKEVCDCGEDEDGECLPCPTDEKQETHPEKKS